MHRFGMLWNFNSLAQLLQGGPGALGNASCAYDRPPFQQRICLQGRWNAAWCTGCFTRNVYSPRTYFATYESWFFFYALYDISSDRHILNGFFTGLCVCGLSNDKITSTLLFLGLMASWNSFLVTCYSRISRPADVAFCISPMVLPGTPNGRKKSRIYVVWSVFLFRIVWWC